MAKKKAKNDNANDTNETTDVAPATKGKKKPRQGELAGFENADKIAAVEAAFEEWDEARVKAKSAKAVEDLKYTTVIAEMQEAKKKIYKFGAKDGTTITIKLKTSKTKFAVHRAKPEAFKEEGE